MFKRVFWFWHFWVGLLLGPFVILLAATGAIYVFKDEIELRMYSPVQRTSGSDWKDADPADVEKTVLHVLNDAPEYRLYGLYLETDTGRAPSVAVISQTAKPGFRRVYVSSDFQSVRGEIPDRNFFSIVLDLHRNLIAGTPGRILVELATSWLIVSSLIGLKLWWPRNWRSMAGVFIPRLRAKPYVVTRDLHSIVGVWLCAFLVLVGGTGLLYSYFWGQAFNAIGYASGQYDVFLHHPQHDDDTLDIDLNDPNVQAKIATVGWSAARNLEPRYKLISVEVPEPNDEKGTVEILAGTGTGPYVSYASYHHPLSGETISTRTVGQSPPMLIWLLWNYPLHVGSFGGLFTKWLWLFLAVLAIALPITGYAMVWIRFKNGKPLLPRTTELAPGWLRWALIATGVFLPTVGISLLLVTLGVFVRSQYTKLQNRRPAKLAQERA